MISNAFMIYAGVAMISIVAGIFLFRYIRWRIQPLPERPEMSDEEQAILRSLANPVGREHLRKALEMNNIVGDADIRDGKVYEPMSLDRMHPLLTVIDNANAALHRFKNPAACSLYIRDSVNGKFMLVPDLDLADLREIAELLRAAVAERAARSRINGN